VNAKTYLTDTGDVLQLAVSPLGLEITLNGSVVRLDRDDRLALGRFMLADMQETAAPQPDVFSPLGHERAVAAARLEADLEANASL
jgi:hypothetical protein